MEDEVENRCRGTTKNAPRKIKVPILHNASNKTFLEEIYPKRNPVVLKGLDIGPCICKWTVDYLSSQTDEQEVKIHVCPETQMDFISKNFYYRTLPFTELVKRASRDVNENFFISQDEKYYLRSLGEDPRKDVADIFKQFPCLAGDIKIPEFFDQKRFFSSVFRIASKSTQLWTHYDVMDNILMQIVGKKRVVLFPPMEANSLYLKGDKSKVLDIDHPDLEKFPLFTSASRHECVLDPGDVLFIPALWFHNVISHDFSVAVNVFWRHLDLTSYDTRDPYGNKDPLPASRAFQILDRAVKVLEELPPVYRDFYGRRMISRIQEKTHCTDPP